MKFLLRSNRRWMNAGWTLLAGFLLVMLSMCQTPEKTSKKPPNILFILSDDHTSQAWGVYGGILAPYVKNDHIRRLANDGVLLNNAFCTNSICVPSRAAILSGRYSHRNGVFGLSDGYHPDSASLAKHLKAAGYQTALFGKWHLKGEPAGFDQYMVLPGQGRYRNPILITPQTWADTSAWEAYEGYSADVITDQSLKWLQQQDLNQPFFLCTHFKATHEPFYYPERYADFLADTELPYPPSLNEFGRTVSGRTHDGWPLEILGERYLAGTGDRYPGTSFSLEGLDSLAARKKIYQKFVQDFLRTGAAIDDNIGRLIAYLDRTGLYDNTLIIYTADQGYFLGEHGYFDKRFIYEESLRMPTVVTWPTELPASQKLDDIILNIDFPALLLDVAGAQPLTGMQGRSFLSNLQGQTPPDWRREMYYRYWSNQPERPAHLGIRNDRYKLAFFYGQPRNGDELVDMPHPPGWEFYDLVNDSLEQYNAIDDPKYTDEISRMRVRLNQLKQELGDDDAGQPLIKGILVEDGIF